MMATLQKASNTKRKTLFIIEYKVDGSHDKLATSLYCNQKSHSTKRNEASGLKAVPEFTMQLFKPYGVLPTNT
jgi:hypothetical protein